MNKKTFLYSLILLIIFSIPSIVWVIGWSVNFNFPDFSKDFVANGIIFIFMMFLGYQVVLTSCKENSIILFFLFYYFLLIFFQVTFYNVSQDSYLVTLLEKLIGMFILFIMTLGTVILPLIIFSISLVHGYLRKIICKRYNVD